MKIKQEISVFDTRAEFVLGDVIITIRTSVQEPSFLIMPEQKIVLTAKGIDELLDLLTSAKELIGEDFIVHHDGSISITIDDGKKLVDTQYVNLADYKNGIVAE